MASFPLLHDPQATLNKFPHVVTLVVGDIMLDRYWWGAVERISPEAPVPVVQLQHSSYAPGGAANVAANVASMGGKAVLVGVIGTDEEGGMFPDVLRAAGVVKEGLVIAPDRPTTVKTRIIAHHQHVVRIDRELRSPLDQALEDAVAERVHEQIESAHVMVLSDYGKGLLSPVLIQRLVQMARAGGIPVLIDPKGRDYARYKGASLLTPNRSEAAQATNLDLHDPKVVDKAGRILLDQLEIDALLVTQGEDGMTLFERSAPPLHLEALARQVYDVTGAGDTVIAALALGLGAHANLPTAARIANLAAGLVVEQVGTATAKLDQLLAEARQLEA